MQLKMLGAVPTQEMLAELIIDEAISINGVLIDDFAEFEVIYSEAYDLWGIYQEVNNSSGTYSTYELMIQDAYPGGMLSTQLTQSGAAGFEIFIEKSTAVQMLAKNFSDVVFERLVHVNTSTSHQEYITGENSFFKAMIGFADDITTGEASFASGNTQSHHIFCDIAPTVRYIYVKAPHTSSWQHTLTTNSIFIAETHDWYYVIANHGVCEPHSGNESSVNTEFPDDFQSRLTQAISAHRNNSSPAQNYIESYTVAAIAEDQLQEIFTLPVPCPATQFDLFAMHKDDRVGIIVIGAILLLAAAGITVLIITKNTSETGSRRINR